MSMTHRSYVYNLPIYCPLKTTFWRQLSIDQKAQTGWPELAHQLVEIAITLL